MGDSMRSSEQTPTLHSRVRSTSKNLEPPRTAKRRPAHLGPASNNVDWSLKASTVSNEDNWPKENKPILANSIASV